jgi:hypothetical protein
MDAWLEQPPPWKIFPTMQPLEVAARQGLQEAWVDQVWRPFWATLTPLQRERYFAHWQASAAWKDAIRGTFEIPADFDAEADLADSQRFFEERARAQAAAEPPSWGQRLARLLRRR